MIKFADPNQDWNYDYQVNGHGVKPPEFPVKFVRIGRIRNVVGKTGTHDTVRYSHDHRHLVNNEVILRLFECYLPSLEETEGY